MNPVTFTSCEVRGSAIERGTASHATVNHLELIAKALGVRAGSLLK